VSASRQRDSAHGSTLRLLAGSVLLLAAFALMAIGFSTLIKVLDSGGYGTVPMVQALGVLGAAGAAFAGGIATLIWDIAKRYELPGQPEIRNQNRSGRAG
jgi:hypothetical protein